VPDLFVDVKDLNVRIDTLEFEHDLTYVRNLHIVYECKVVSHHSRTRC
jgi:hypothetical protein